MLEMSFYIMTIDGLKSEYFSLEVEVLDERWEIAWSCQPCLIAVIIFKAIVNLH